MGKMKEIDLMLNEFEILGKELLKHKYLYYIKAKPILSDYDYDALEHKYVNLAKELKLMDIAEPSVHMLSDGLWEENVGWWTIPASKIDFPSEHPWAEEIIKENN